MSHSRKGVLRGRMFDTTKPWFLFQAYCFPMLFAQDFLMWLWPFLLCLSIPHPKIRLTLWWIPSKQTYVLFSEIHHQVLPLVASLSLVLLPQFSWRWLSTQRGCMLLLDNPLISEAPFHCASLLQLSSVKSNSLATISVISHFDFRLFRLKRDRSNLVLR